MPQRYFLEHINHTITGSDAHHIKKVMRMKTGDDIIVCSEGRCFNAVLKALDPEVIYDLKDELKRPNHLHITLIQGMPKHPKSEVVSKYATIYGVSHIIFTEMNRSIAKVESNPNKLNRLQTIAKEAAELAHRFDVPGIDMVAKFEKIDLKVFDVVILADENEKSTTLEKAVPMVSSNQKIAIIIGPEGGISEVERNRLLHQNVTSVTLGQNILPTEIASLYALSYLSLKNS